MFKRVKTTLAACAAGAVVTATVALVATASPAMAYGKANWQTTFAATATVPGTGNGFGFWGWCDFAGGVTSGTSGDCQVTQYSHTHTGNSFTCHENVNLTTWSIAPSPPAGSGDFLVTGSLTVTPSALTDACVAIFPFTNPFFGVDTGIPGAAGHYAFGVGGIPGGVPPGTVGTYNVTVTQVP